MKTDASTPGGSSRRSRRWPGWLAASATALTGCMTERTSTRPASPPVGTTTVSSSPGRGGSPVASARPDADDLASAAKEPAPARGDTPVQAISPGLATRDDRPKADPPVGLAATIVPAIPPAVAPPVVPPAAQEYPVDITAALRLAEVENPEIAEARQRILEAVALQQSARALLLPTLNAGFNYHGHTGDLQRSSGTILSLSEQSLYVGGGARTLAAESVAVPAVNIASPLADAIYQPLAARQNVERTRFDAGATANAVLLDVAILYFDMAAAEAELGLRRQTEAEALEAARLTAAYAKAGQGFVADADRAATLLRLIHRGVEGAEEEAAVAAARLSRRLHLDPVVRLRPLVAGMAPVSLVDPSSRAEDLIRVALERRPELGARAAAIAEAQTRLRAEYARPFLPTLWIGFSGGGFGGGSNLVTPLLGNFGGRTDYDVRAFWTLQDLGLGNLAIQKQRRSVLGQQVGAQSLAIAAIRREVSAALGQAKSARDRIEDTRRQLKTAEEGFREDLIRLRNTVGRPIELTNSLELLSQARLDHLRAILEYDRAELRLFVSLGSPPPLDRPATDPLPPAPVAAPPLSPPPLVQGPGGLPPTPPGPPRVVAAHATASGLETGPR